MFLVQLNDIVIPACPGSSCQEHLPRKAREHPTQMPEPPQLAPLDVEEQQLYSELLQGDRATHLSKGAPRHPVEETHFGLIS